MTVFFQVEHHKGSRVEYMVKVKAQFKRRSTANNVEIYVPVPDDADTPKFRVRSQCDLCYRPALESGCVLAMLTCTRRLQRVLCSTHQIRARSFGKSSSSVEDGNSLCVPTLACRVSGEVRVLPPAT